MIQKATEISRRVPCAYHFFVTCCFATAFVCFVDSLSISIARALFESLNSSCLRSRLYRSPQSLCATLTPQPQAVQAGTFSAPAPVSQLWLPCPALSCSSCAVVPLTYIPWAPPPPKRLRDKSRITSLPSCASRRSSSTTRKNRVNDDPPDSTTTTLLPPESPATCGCFGSHDPTRDQCCSVPGEGRNSRHRRPAPNVFQDHGCAGPHLYRDHPTMAHRRGYAVPDFRWMLFQRLCS